MTETHRDSREVGLLQPDDPRTRYVEIWVTGDLISPDDTDTNVYGEPTEPGYGQTLESGWVEDGYPWQVFEEMPESPHTVIDLEDEYDIEEIEETESLEKYIEEKIGDIIGAIDHYDGRSAYAADEDRNYYTGESMILAAHVYRYAHADPERR